MIVYTYLVVRHYTAGERYPTKSLPSNFMKRDTSHNDTLVNAYIVKE